MKKQLFFSIIFIAVLTAFSMVFTPAVFAGNATHTITIVNQSTYELLPTNNPHVVVYNNSNSTCAQVPPDTCSAVNLTPPAKIAAKSSAVINMTGPTGCNISMWQTYYQPGKGKVGTIQCGISPVNSCNSVNKNYTCTITQTTGDTAKNGNNAAATSQ